MQDLDTGWKVAVLAGQAAVIVALAICAGYLLPSLGRRIEAFLIKHAAVITPPFEAFAAIVTYVARLVGRGLFWIGILAIFAGSWSLIFRSGPMTVFVVIVTMIVRPLVFPDRPLRLRKDG